MSNHNRLSWLGHRVMRIVIAEKHGTEQLHPLGEQRQSAAAVGEYPLNVGITDQRAGEDKIAYRAGGVENELQHRPGPAKGDRLGAAAVRWD